jgi:hypothetical protein
MLVLYLALVCSMMGVALGSFWCWEVLYWGCCTSVACLFSRLLFSSGGLATRANSWLSWWCENYNRGFFVNWMFKRMFWEVVHVQGQG